MSGVDTERPTGAPSVALFRAVVRGAVRGAGFGGFAGIVEVFLWTVGRLRLGLAMPRDTLLLEVVVSIALGLVLGVLFVPLSRLRTRWASPIHGLSIFVAFIVLAWLAGLPSLAAHIALMIVPFVVALGAFIGASILEERRPELRLVPFAISALLLATTMAAPMVVDASAAAPEPGARAPRAPASAPDVLIVVLDTVRADHVGAYGYARDTTPVFDALAAESTVFLDATAPATWSLPSHASLFTGVFPTTHGAHAEHRALDVDGPPTLAEILAAHGYETRCFTANPWFSEALGLVRGFASSDEAWRVGRTGQTRLFALRLLDGLGLGADEKGGADVVSGFESWASRDPAARAPTFAFVNLVEAHFPYHQVPAEHLARFTDADPDRLRDVSLALMEAQFGAEIRDPDALREPSRDMYDAGVHYADHLLGRLIEALRARGTLEHTLVIVLSDHGELLGEYGAFGHGTSLHEEETRVPLLVRYPPAFVAGRVVTVPVSTVGVFATVLDVAGISPPRAPQVESLREVAAGGLPPNYVISERFRLPDDIGGDAGDSPLFRRDVRFRTVREGQWKLVSADEGPPLLFDVSSDEGERLDLADAWPWVVSRLSRQLDSFEHDYVTRMGGPEVDADTRARLRALGYSD
jgi:arylsulfatase A-like enzyme